MLERAGACGWGACARSCVRAGVYVVLCMRIRLCMNFVCFLLMLMSVKIFHNSLACHKCTIFHKNVIQMYVRTCAFSMNYAKII